MGKSVGRLNENVVALMMVIMCVCICMVAWFATEYNVYNYFITYEDEDEEEETVDVRVERELIVRRDGSTYSVEEDIDVLEEGNNCSVVVNTIWDLDCDAVTVDFAAGVYEMSPCFGTYEYDEDEHWLVSILSGFDNVTLDGNGVATIQIEEDSVVSGDYEGCSVIGLDGVVNWTIRGFTIDCNIDNVTVDGLGLSGVFSYQGCEDIQITDCVFINSKMAVYGDGGSCVNYKLDNSTVYGGGMDGFVLFNQPDDSVVSDNVFHDVAVGVRLDGVEEVFVVDNWINASVGGVWITNGSYDCVVRDNVIWSNCTGSGGMREYVFEVTSENVVTGTAGGVALVDALDDDDGDRRSYTEEDMGSAGPTVEYCLMPNSDSSVNWDVVYPGGSHYEVVDDVPYDGGSSYVETSSNGDVDRFGVVDTGDWSGYVDIDVELFVVHSKTATQPALMSAGVYVGSTYYEGVACNLVSGVWTNESYEWELNPNTASEWSESDIDSLMLQITTSDASPSVRCTSIGVIVTVEYAATVDYELDVELLWDDVLNGSECSCFNLTMQGYRSGSEDFKVYLWDEVADEWDWWDDIDVGSDGWFNVSLSWEYYDDVGDDVMIRIVGSDEEDDDVQDVLYLDVGLVVRYDVGDGEWAWGVDMIGEGDGCLVSQNDIGGVGNGIRIYGEDNLISNNDIDVEGVEYDDNGVGTVIE